MGAISTTQEETINAVEIDVVKKKSMMMALRPMNEVALKAREYPRTEVGLEQMALGILGLGEGTQVIMEATDRYHEPVAAALHKYGVHVIMMNPLFIKQSGGGSTRKRSRPTRPTPRRVPNMSLITG